MTHALAAARAEERERCAGKAEAEPLPGEEGDEMPTDMALLCMTPHGARAVIWAAVRATKKSIAAAIRAGA